METSFKHWPYRPSYGRLPGGGEDLFYINYIVCVHRNSNCYSRNCDVSDLALADSVFLIVLTFSISMVTINPLPSPYLLYYTMFIQHCTISNVLFRNLGKFTKLVLQI